MKPLIRETNPGIYIHVPFCAAKCPYCNFYSVKAEESLMDAYTEQICRALAASAERWQRRADTLCFGGGTPILLGARRIERIVSTARRHFRITKRRNHAGGKPCFYTGRNAAGSVRRRGQPTVFRHAVRRRRRASDPGSRRHTAKEAALAVLHAQAAGFSNISLDLMLGIPQQTAQSVERSIGFCAETGITHISAYLLKIEEGTPLTETVWRLAVPTRTSRPNAICRRWKLWRGTDFANTKSPTLPNRDFTAATTVNTGWARNIWVSTSRPQPDGGRRFFFPRDLAGFLAAENPLSLICGDGPGGDPQEYALLGLRLCQGIDRKEAAAAYPDY